MNLLQYIPKYNTNDRWRALPFYCNSYEPGIFRGRVFDPEPSGSIFGP